MRSRITRVSSREHLADPAFRTRIADPHATDAVTVTNVTNSNSVVAAIERMLATRDAANALHLSEFLVGEGSEAGRWAALRENGSRRSLPRADVAAVGEIATAPVNERAAAVTLSPPSTDHLVQAMTPNPNNVDRYTSRYMTIHHDERSSLADIHQKCGSTRRKSAFQFRLLGRRACRKAPFHAFEKRRITRLHAFLPTLAALTVLGAVAGAHGFNAKRPKRSIR